MIPDSAAPNHEKPEVRSEVEIRTPAGLFAGGGEMGEIMRAFDWSQTPIGAPERWPQSLKAAVRIILASRYPMFVWWGRELTNLYNDPYRSFLGIKHPGALGRSAREVWAEIWDQIGPRADAVLLRGESTYDEALLLLMGRHGYTEETYFTFSYSPLPDDHGANGGLFCAVTEETERVIGERRIRLLHETAAATALAHTPPEVCTAASQCLAMARKDLPFGLIYLVDADGKTLVRSGEWGIAADHPTASARVFLENGAERGWPFARVLETGELLLVQTTQEQMAGLPTGAWTRPPENVALVPIAQPGQSRAAAVLVLGLNPYRQFKDEFRGFVCLLANQIAASIANAVAYAAERQRADALAELDHAKTVFFSNVSHEFRTPLTLMLGPVEEVLARSRERLLPEEQEQLALVRRNALRLLKLVNTLLDFSRIEAGRMRATYAPTDLPKFTAEIASAFRSAMERAGLQFQVSCEPSSEPVYIDRRMWEQIVLNLVSNALKFTFEGVVTVTARTAGSAVELIVSDTGVGIPENEIPKVLERFYRAESSRSRTHEGTGIGLALVQELVKLHGGTVQVASEVGRGSTFTVSIPRGNAHLSPDRIEEDPALPAVGLSAESYIEEATRLLPSDSNPILEPISYSSATSRSDTSPLAPAPGRPRVMLVDDNADMRSYVARLLGQEYEVFTACDGEEAVGMARRLRPAVLLTDIMMPKLDGFGLLRAIRSDPELKMIPVILLSARAGEDSRIEGFQADADDYLLKPFTSRELLARVATHARMGNMRREAAEREAVLRAQADRERRALEEMLACIPAAIGLLSGPERRWTFVNHYFVQASGRSSRAEFIGKTMQESFPELDGQGFVELMDQVYRTGHAFVGRETKTLLRRSGNSSLEELYFDFIYQPMRDANGNVERILVHATEVTDRVAARKAIEISEQEQQKLAAVVESSDDAIVSKDLKGIVTSWNASAEKIFGFTREEMLGQPIVRIIPPELQDDEHRILATIARGERIDHFETVRVTKSGERVDVSLTISPIKDRTGKIFGAAKIARDITQRKKAEHALRIAERLASVGRLASTVAHEVNNPLEAVTNLVYLARNCSSMDEIRKYLGMAEQELARVSHVTKQTLGFYRETVVATPTKLSGLIEPLLSIFSTRTRNKPIQIRSDIRQDPEIVVVPGEIRQLVANLLSNSIDSVEGAGEIRLRVSAAREWSGEGRRGLRLTVADSGSGISNANRAKLFEPFFTTKQDVGTGLGLWVCSNIVAKHHGSIRVRSTTTPGRNGTAFAVFLPFGKQWAEAQELKRAV